MPNTIQIPALLMTIAQRIWFIWCILAFLFTGVIAGCFYILIFNLFNEKKANDLTFLVTKYWGKSLLAFMMVKVEKIGIDNLNFDNHAYILVSNHLSMCDIPICMASSPIAFSFLAKKEVDRIPIVGYLCRNMHVYVDRKNKEARKQTVEAMQSHIREDRSILIYPEGTRNTTNALLKRFYDGAFKLAIETGRPILPLTIVGSQKITNPKEPYKASPGHVKCIWSSALTTKNLTIDDVDYLKNKVRNIMSYELQQHQEEQLA